VVAILEAHGGEAASARAWWRSLEAHGGEAASARRGGDPSLEATVVRRPARGVVAILEAHSAEAASARVVAILEAHGGEAASARPGGDPGGHGAEAAARGLVAILKAHGGKEPAWRGRSALTTPRGPEMADVPSGLQTSAKSRGPLGSVGFLAADLRLSTESPSTAVGEIFQARTRECVT